MKVRLYHRHEIIDNQWNTFLNHSPQNIIYAYSWYLDAVTTKWCAFVLEEDEEWQAVMPIPLKKKWGIWVVEQPLFCQILGVFHKNEVIKTNSQLLENALYEHFKYVSVYNGQNLVNFQKTLFTHTIHLNRSYKEIQAAFNNDRLNNLRIGQNFGWKLDESEDLAPLIELFKENHVHKIEGGVSEKAYIQLQKLYQVLKTNAEVRIIYCKQKNQIEAGAMFVIFQNRIIYLFNAASKIGRKGNARTLLISKMLEEFQNSEYVFDFESPELQSVVDFYLSFGSEPQSFGSIRYNRMPFPIRQIQNWRLRSQNR